MTVETYEVHFEAPQPHHAVHLMARDESGIVSSLQLQEWHTPNASVCWVFTREDRRRQGAARMLLQIAIGVARAAGKESLILGVMKDAPAENLYRSEGFRQYQTDEKQNYLALFL